MTTETEGAAEAVAEDVAAEVTAEAPASTDLGDDAAAAPEPKAEKPRQSAQERIDELTAKRREAERDAEYWKAKALQAPAQEAQAQPESQAATTRPDPSKYAEGVYDPQYAEDLTDWKADQAVERRFTQREAQSRTQTAVQTFDQRAAQQFPDGEPAGLAAIRRMPQLSSVVQEVVTTLENGPRIADHLGSHPSELQRISALPPVAQALELAKLDQRFTTPPAAATKTATDAPPATPQVRGSGGRFTVAPDTDDFAAFDKAFP